MAQAARGSSLLADAYREIQKGSLLLIIGSLLADIGATVSLIGVFTPVVSFSYIPRFNHFNEVWRNVGIISATLIPALTASLIGFLLSFIAVYAYLVPGAKKLGDAQQKYSTASKLISIGFVWGLILLILGIVLLIFLIVPFLSFFALLAVPIILIGALLFLIGKIGIIILSFDLHESENNTLFLIAGILFIVGLFLPVLSFIAWILMYVALGESIRKLEAPSPVSTA